MDIPLTRGKLSSFKISQSVSKFGLDEAKSGEYASR